MDGYYQPCTVLPSLLIPTGRKHSNEASHDRDRRQPGIGAAVAALAATRGYAVCVNYKSRADRAQAVVDAIRGQGGTAVAVGADVSTEAGILALFSATDRELGPVAALVNNAGILETQMRVEQMDAARLQRIMQANVVGPFNAPARRCAGCPSGTAARAASSSMCPRPPRLGSPGEYVDYAASKGALDTMTIGLAKEVGAEGIRVNAVRPGPYTRRSMPAAASRTASIAWPRACRWAGADASRKSPPRCCGSARTKRPTPTAPSST